MRLCRITRAALEPDPRVRIAALHSLAAFETADAAAGIYDATDETKEPDPQVREAAKALIQKGLAASRY
jgi:HEAT repeat protein